MTKRGTWHTIITIGSSTPTATWHQSISALFDRNGRTDRELFELALEDAIVSLPPGWTYQGERPTVLFYRAVKN